VAEALPLAVEHPFVVEAILLPTVAEDLTSTMMLLLPKSLFVNFVVVLATLLLDATKGWNLSNLPTHISNHSKPTSKIHMPTTHLQPCQLKKIGILIPGPLIMSLVSINTSISHPRTTPARISLCRRWFRFAYHSLVMLY
jgi:hypothetical protein